LVFFGFLGFFGFFGFFFGFFYFFVSLGFLGFLGSNVRIVVQMSGLWFKCRSCGSEL
jgi:hypothetical protein